MAGAEEGMSGRGLIVLSVCEVSGGHMKLKQVWGWVFPGCSVSVLP